MYFFLSIRIFKVQKRTANPYHCPRITSMNTSPKDSSSRKKENEKKRVEIKSYV